MTRKKLQVSVRWNAEYKCRRCGSHFFTPGNYEIPFSEYLGEWYWPRTDREAYHKYLSFIAEVTFDIPVLPDMFAYHPCSETAVGIADCVGWTNPRQGKIIRGYWHEIKTEQQVLGAQMDLLVQDAHIKKNEQVNQNSYKNDPSPKTDEQVNTPTLPPCGVLVAR